MIHISTLARYSDYKPGIYLMSALKEMKGTDSFLALPDETKACQIETLEVCQTRKYLEKVRSECGCIPWSLSSALIKKVSL